MTERLLHFIWQFQYFSRTELSTTTGEPVQVLHPGNYNTHQGPDFNGARIRIGSTTWAGTAELHVRSSDWGRHRHEYDRNYRNVILHVVWEDDGVWNNIPVLELRERVPGLLLERYTELMGRPVFVSCEKMIQTVNELTWSSWKERLMAERLLRKAGIMEQLLEASKGHWEECCWRLLAKNFGMPVNAAAFEEVARTLPMRLLSRHRSQIHQLEALLLGQAGLLNEAFVEDYCIMLQKEYQFLLRKYGLQPIHQPVHFLRMRPGNFPTLRLAQLAAVLHKNVQLFSAIRESASLKEVMDLFSVTASDYWNFHYSFGEATPFLQKHLGRAMIGTVIVNTIVPVLFAYGTFHQEETYKEKALKWLRETAPEENSITKGFQRLGIATANAAESQALIELKNEYCDKKRCLDCGVGNAILKG